MVNIAHNNACCAEIPPVGLLARVGAAIARYRARAAHRRAMAGLLVADPRLLKDIGLDRATVTGHYMDPEAAFRARSRD
ncbi:hypothetical protein [Zavarzinia aquatilis]|uniref:DUF1127 domain-containing protein n=1 Tax=Zavarzinia aquatilis TaxID=2211142 RepID=A0A317EDW5_9PROT|nr:hypothetical protein [Zavarzinia aquatilis]PWR24454.1 hypothetical protein DKG74_06510 [Zavarzinia aquatilis]